MIMFMDFGSTLMGASEFMNLAKTTSSHSRVLLRYKKPHGLLVAFMRPVSQPAWCKCSPNPLPLLVHRTRDRPNFWFVFRPYATRPFLPLLGTSYILVEGCTGLCIVLSVFCAKFTRFEHNYWVVACWDFK